MPALKLTQENSENYMEQIARIDFGMPLYQQEENPIIDLLDQISTRFNPDFIFMDARTGINDVGGLMLSKYSDLAVLLSYGNEQNMAGLRLVLPRVMTAKIIRI